MKLLRKEEQTNEDVRIKFGDTILIESSPRDRYYLVGHTYDTSSDLLILVNIETGRQWTSPTTITRDEYSAMVNTGKGLSLDRIATIITTASNTMRKVEMEAKITC